MEKDSSKAKMSTIQKRTSMRRIRIVVEHDLREFASFFSPPTHFVFVHGLNCQTRAQIEKPLATMARGGQGSGRTSCFGRRRSIGFYVGGRKAAR